MLIRRMFHSPRARRGLALGAVILSLGGLVLVQAPAGADPTTTVQIADARNGAHFHGPGAHGTLALSHGYLQAGTPQRVFAELRLKADAENVARERAPLSLVVVLDTSGSMDGDKLREAKRSVKRLLDNMRDDDQVALVRYDAQAQVVQDMARVGDVRNSLSRRIDALHADGGTNIPWALRQGLSILKGSDGTRVKRLVLVSDGLDDTRSEAVELARNSAESGATISTLGIGLDFDEAYLADVSRAGHGNFAFVDKPSQLARFLERELKETAATTVRNAVARIRLPRGLRLVRVSGADARSTELGVELSIGTLFAGDERRIALELEGDVGAGETLPLAAQMSWSTLGGEDVRVSVNPLSLAGTTDSAQVELSRDDAVFGNCISAIASLRQMEAAEAFRKGDRRRARQLIDDNMRELRAAQARAPGAVAKSLGVQADGYAATGEAFDQAEPESDEGKAAAKRVWSKESQNTQRRAY